jgi:hypothetical protein
MDPLKTAEGTVGAPTCFFRNQAERKKKLKFFLFCAKPSLFCYHVREKESEREKEKERERERERKKERGRM